MPDMEKMLLKGTPQEQVFAAARLAESVEGRRLLASIASDSANAVEIRVNASSRLDTDAEREVQVAVARSYLTSKESADLRWLGVQRTVQVGLFELTPLVVSIRGDQARVGWLSSLSGN